jgi:hypothetical protein
MAIQKFRQELFMDRNLAVFKSGEFANIVVDQDHFVAEVSEASACDQSYVSGTYYSNLHA